MRTFPILGTATLALTAAGAHAAPRSYALPEPTAELRAPKDPAHQAGFEAGLRRDSHRVRFVANHGPSTLAPTQEIVAEHHERVGMLPAQGGGESGSDRIGTVEHLVNLPWDSLWDLAFRCGGFRWFSWPLAGSTGT